MSPETHGFQNGLILNQGVLLKFFFSYILSTCLFLEINPFPYLITLVDNKITLLDMDRNQVAWMFSAEGDVGAMGYTADDAVGYCAQGDSLILLRMDNRSSTKVFCYVIPLNESGVSAYHTSL